MTLEESPLAEAAHRAALRALARRPDPKSRLGQAVAPTDSSLHAKPEAKEAFAELQRAAQVKLRRPVPQHELVHFLVAFATDHEEVFLAEVEKGGLS